MTALLWPGHASADDAACGRVLGAGAIYDAARGNCVAPNQIEGLCRQLPGFLRWQRTGRLGTCEFALPNAGQSRLPPGWTPPAPDDAPPGCEEAKVNVEWVMLRDRGARGSYRVARQSRSPFEALMFAQRHNPSAQASLRRCAQWAGNYAAWLEKNAREPGEAPHGNADDKPKQPATALEPNADCATIGPRQSDYREAYQRFERDPPVWNLRYHVNVRCREPVQIFFCFRHNDGRRQLETKTFGPGYTQPNPVHFPMSYTPESSFQVFPGKCLLRERCRPRC